MAANTPIILKQPAQQSVVDLYKACATNFLASWNIREQLKHIDLLYMREQDKTAENAKAEAANRAGDPTKFRNIQVPVVMTSVESAVTYQSSVFLTGTPIFGVSSSAKYMDAALQMETVIDDQSTKGGWPREFQLIFRDGFKYNLGFAEVDWDRKKIYAPETDINFSASQAKLTEVLWEGNVVKRLDPYNVFFDSRYKPVDIAQRGEFFGYSDLYSRVEFIKFMQSLTVRMNFKRAAESGLQNSGTAFPNEYYIPELNPNSLLNTSQAAQGFNWMAWAGLAPRANSSISFRDCYIVTKFYARIIPSDHGIASASPNSPQIWKFYIVNGQTLVYAERQSNAHDMIPVFGMQPMEDGLGYQTKSLAQNSSPFQAVSSALVNSAIAARKRAIADRGIYDPSRIDPKAINNDSASAKIPVRPSHYGRPLNEAYYQIPYNDQQSGQALSDMQVMMGLNEQVTGLNRAQQGQFQKGNKTLYEYQNVMGNADARQQNISLLLEYQFFSPIKEVLKLNVLQYQAAASVYSRELEQEVNVDPVTLRKAHVLFKVSDGQTPASKQMNTDAFASASQAIAQTPGLAGAYNLGPMFSYLFKTQRADVAQFEKSPQQLQYEQALGAWQGTVATIMDTYSKLKKPDGSSYTLQEMQAALPPQPTPQQFGIDPAKPPVGKPEPQGTILEQVQQAMNATQNANQPSQ